MLNFSKLDTFKIRLAHKILFFVMIFLVSGCSTKKNTWTSRTAQAVNTRFNVYFNGITSYNEGLKNILKANQEDYSTIIPMYPISRHSNANAAISNMDRTIEKCRKAIKVHSIKVKPEKNYKKANDPEYKLFYNQEEFNPALKDVWLLLGQAEFHKGDFLGSAGTFSYVAKHYSTDNDVTTKCELWTARAYGEMGWIYEAEQVISKINQDNIKGSIVGLFASTNADILLKKHQYKDAIPFLEMALSKETDKDMKMRFSYLLAQLYEKTGDNKDAYEAFTKVIKMNPPYEMDFYARINRTQLGMGNITQVRHDLKNMLKNSNNKDYIDQIYFALGNTYIAHNDTTKAIENYKLSVEKSTRNGIDKGITLVTLGDIYYKQKNYVAAQPCYDEAGKILPNDNDDYARVTRMSEMLGELVAQNNIVLLQDSLQRLSTMPESKRMEVVNKIIEKLIADEKAAAQKELDDKQKATQDIENSFAGMTPIGSSNLRTGSGGIGNWYFYNPVLMRTGQAEFLKKWGKRKLEDNWRRTNKATALFADDNAPESASADTTNASQPKTEEISDNKKPEFYLRQIPVTPAQIEKSNADIADALYAMGLIYKDKIEDYPMAISTFEEFVRRFGTDKRVPDAYFQIYMIYFKLEDKSKADVYRNKILNDYPNSQYQKILSQPDYTERLQKMYKEQDSIYNLTYKAYNENDFKTVFNQVAYIQKNYPLSTLMPKFLFLNALSIGKNETPEKFKSALNELVTDYPESDVSAMAKDIMALIKQGKEVKTGTTSGTLLALRDETANADTTTISTKKFSPEKLSKHRLLLISAATDEEMNKLMYNIATFNFSRFMIKDFDLAFSRLDSTRKVLSVTNFESYEEVGWYINSINSDPVISALCSQLQVQEVNISEYNFGLLKNTYTLDDYLAYQKTQLEGVQAPQVATTTSKSTVKAKPATIKNEIVNKKDSVNILDANAVKQLLSTEKTDKNSALKALEQSPEKAETKVDTSKPVETATTTQQPAKVNETPVVTPAKPVEESVPLYKGLFAYKANDPHFIAIYIVSGTIDFEKTKTLFNAYNKQNYGIMNLKVSLETFNNQQVIIIGSLADAQIAKSYLLRMVKERGLFEGLKGANYRNLIGTQKNLNTMMQQNALDVYFEFMKEYYLK